MSMAYKDKEKKKVTRSKWYEKNKEKVLAASKLYYAKNKESHKERRRIRGNKWHAENRESVSKRHADWYKNPENKAKALENSKIRYSKNKDKILKRQSEYYNENRQEKLKYNKQWYFENRERLKLTPTEYKRKNLKKYGISLEQYNDMLESQNYCCDICKQEESQVIKGKIASLSVDHDHLTGKIRGLLCNNCNNGLGRFKDDIEKLASAILYLKK